jgi:cell wall-associated NlpC family hydrolase
VISCTWQLRRHASRVLAGITTLTLISGLVVIASDTPAHAADLTSLRAEAAALIGRIQSLGYREDALSQRYDQAELVLGQTEAAVRADRARLLRANAETAHARAVLQDAAISAYVNAGGSSVVAPSMSSANTGLLRSEYEQSLASNQMAAENQYRTASLEDATAEATLRSEEATERSNLASISSAQREVTATQAQLQALYRSDQGQIATIVAQEEAAQRAEEQRAANLAAQRRAAAQQAAQTTTTTASSPTSSPTSTTAPSPAPSTGGGGGGGGFSPPPDSSAAAIAVAAAESRVGDPYVWGGAGPNDFDCSGLVMWAYEQAGIQLPHFSGAQWADTVHIPMSQLQPGDLVFFSNPDEHVAMYVGNGDVVQAPYTGADVQIVPMYSEFTLASRVQ